MPDIVLPDHIERELRSAARSAGIGGPCIVILYNCDCHSFDEVIAQLQKATGCSQATAEQIAEEAHQTGRAVAYTGDDESASASPSFSAR